MCNKAVNILGLPAIKVLLKPVIVERLTYIDALFVLRLLTSNGGLTGLARPGLSAVHHHTPPGLSQGVPLRFQGMWL